MFDGTTSILPEDYLEKRVARRTNLFCLVLFFLVMAGIVAVFFVTDQQHGEIAQAKAQVNKAYREADAAITQLTELQAQNDIAFKKALIAAALMEPVPRTLLLSELVNHMPGDLSLTRFELETEILRQQAAPRTGLQRAQQAAAAQQQAEAVEANPYDIQLPETQVTIVLRGLAPSDKQVSEYMRSLRENELFLDVNLSYTEVTTIQDVEMREFELTMTVNQGLSLQEVHPVRVPRLEHDPMSEQLQMVGGEVRRGD